MTQIINFFLIAPSHTLVGTFYKSAHKFREGGYSVLIHDTSPLIQIINDFKDDVQFRVLVHMDFKGKNNIKEIPDCPGWKEMKQLKKNFQKGNFTFFTRENEIFPSKGAVEGEKLIYENYEIVFGDEMTNENFFNNIPINIKANICNGIEHSTSNETSTEKPVIEKSQISVITPKIDFAVLTALVNDEYTSFTSHMDGTNEKSIFKGKFKEAKEYDYKQNEIAIIPQKKMGMVDASLTTTHIYNILNPKVLILAGVCGGRKTKNVKLYDIIIPENIVDIVTGKFEKMEFVPYGFTEPCNEDLIAQLKIITANPDFVNEEMHRLIPNTDKFKRENEIVKKIEIHYDVMACGPFVLKTENFLEEKSKRLNDKIVGFEMESYGLMRATKLAKSKDKLSLIVKSVMDYTDPKKGDVKTTTDGASVVEIDTDNIPVGENIKAMAAYMSYICTRALLPHIAKFLKDNSI